MRFIVDMPRSSSSTDIAAIFAGDESSESDSYRSGLIILASLTGSMLFIWGTVLVILKWKSKSVGCASGSAFQGSTFDTLDKVSELPRSDACSTDLEDDSLSASTGVEDRKDVDKEVPTNAEYEGSFHSSICASTIERRVSVDDDAETVESFVSVPTAREKRTQIAFFVFSLVTLACIPLVLILSFSPMKDASNASDHYVSDAREIIARVQVALTTIATAANSSVLILDTMQLNFTEICPLANVSDAEAELGVELDTMLDHFLKNYSSLEQEISLNILDIDIILANVEDSLEFVEASYAESDRYLWMVPGILFLLGSLSLITMFGVFLAWKRNSYRRFQCLLSYGILPVFVALSVACWMIAVATAVTTAMSSDGCTPGSTSGTPDDTVHAVLQATTNSSSSLYKYVSTYTNGCRGDDATRVLKALEEEVQSTVDFIWRHLSAVDSSGRATVVGLCGSGLVDDFLAGARDVAKLLTTVRKALSSASESLQCDRINPIYVYAVHDSICTDVASASAWGFLLFFVIGVSTMCMVTLRASWRHTIGEDKIYDEDEVAENMIVDEHEEYLAYISKYKHEWQEYNGIEAHPSAEKGENVPLRNVEDGVSESNMLGSRIDTSSQDDEPPGGVDSFDDERGVEMNEQSQEEAFDPHSSDTQSQSTEASGEISFLSLSDIYASFSQRSPTAGALVIAPAALLRWSNYVDSEDLSISDQSGEWSHLQHKKSLKRQSSETVAKSGSRRFAVPHEHARSMEAQTPSYSAPFDESTQMILDSHDSIEVAVSPTTASRSKIAMVPSPTRRSRRRSGFRPSSPDADDEANSLVLAPSTIDNTMSEATEQASNRSSAKRRASLLMNELDTFAHSLVSSIAIPGALQAVPPSPGFVQFVESAHASHAMRESN
jgi:hypothetical protein